jgi:hypothetical protein
MLIDKPLHRMTLRQLLTHAEKCSRDLIEHLQATLLPRVSDMRELSRPVRRRSHYPTLLAMQNALRKLLEAGAETEVLATYLQEQLTDIHERSKKERLIRH